MNFQFWRRMPLWAQIGLSFVSIAGLCAGVMFPAIYAMDSSHEEQCLARVIDSEWSYTGHWKKGDEALVALAQAEAIARIHLSNAARNKTTICKEGWVPQGKSVLQDYVTGSGSESVRGKIVTQIAHDAVWWGSYKTPWPKEYECATDYKATKLRWSPKLANWDWDLREVGKIGTFTLYCPGA